jgi:hypothetical protein
MVCETMACSSGYCQPSTPPCPVLSCAGEPCGTPCSDASQAPGMCDGVDTCKVGPIAYPPSPCAAGCFSPQDCPGGYAGWTTWDGCNGNDLATCVAGQCGHAPWTCTPSAPCEGKPAGAPCLPLCAELGCPTPNPLPSAHCDGEGTCAVDPPSPCGLDLCSKNADCPALDAPPLFGPCTPVDNCLVPICAEAACATFVAQPRQRSCAPMDAHAGATTCTSTRQGFAWDGSACAPIPVCACAGMDCDVTFPSLAVCQAMHEGC